MRKAFLAWIARSCSRRSCGHPSWSSTQAFYDVTGGRVYKNIIISRGSSGLVSHSPPYSIAKLYTGGAAARQRPHAYVGSHGTAASHQ
jgi:hypothetical protein